MLQTTSISKYHKYSGKFMLTHIVGMGVSTITVADPYPSDYTTTKSYSVQIIAIPQFKNFTLTGTNEKTPAYDTTKKYGGILAYVERIETVLPSGEILQSGHNLRRATIEKVKEKTACHGQEC